MREDDAKKLILARRARFIAAALASAGLATSGEACGGNAERDRHGTPNTVAQGGTGSGGIPQPCLTMILPTGGFGAQPCLSIAVDSGVIDATPDGGTSGGDGGHGGAPADPDDGGAGGVPSGGAPP